MVKVILPNSAPPTFKPCLSNCQWIPLNCENLVFAKDLFYSEHNKSLDSGTLGYDICLKWDIIVTVVDVSRHNWVIHCTGRASSRL